MRYSMKPGDVVSVKVFGGKWVRRVVAEIIENVVVICTQDEWCRAEEENREPDGVGFPAYDVRPIVKKKAVLSRGHV